MSWLEIFGLIASGAVAGVINAVAGGGTLVTFPTLLAFGTAPVVANATSTLALLVGTAGGVYGYRVHLSTVRPWLYRFVPVSVVGGGLGSWLLTHTSDETFSKLIPFLILFATILFIAQKYLRGFANLDKPNQLSGGAHMWGAVVFQFGVAVYGGYFGAGIGILMLASLGFIGLTNIHEMNTLKTLLGSLINLVAASWFIFAGLIHWPKAMLMTAGALAGYYFGSHYAQRIPQARVRQVITAIGFAISAFAFYEEFLK